MEPKNPIIILSFQNCELHCCHLDGYHEQRGSFLKRLSDIEAYFTGKPATSKYRIWYNVDETWLDQAAIAEIAESVTRMQQHIVKIAFIGMGRIQQWALKRKLNSITGQPSFPYSFFADAERAKEWLI